MILFQLLLLGVFVILYSSAKRKSTTLMLVQTLSRHGDRAPSRLYPNDPNSVDDFPNGLGQLTQLGKKQHYDVGKFFRSLYKDFVTPDPKQVFVNSSSEDRCLNSAEAQLASLFKPDEKWMITSDLDWQPIPVHYVSRERDIYLNFKSECPRAKKAASKGMHSKEVKEFYQQHQAMVKAVSNYSGLDYSIPMNAYHLTEILEAERIHNLIIPEWAKSYRGQMEALVYTIFRSTYKAPTFIRLRIGTFLGLLNNNLNSKINGGIPDLKFIMNFAHHVEVEGILAALKFRRFSRSSYCATLLFELHKMADNSMTVRLLYMNTPYPLKDPKQPHVLVLDGCTEFCPVEYFMKFCKGLIPDNWEEECQVES